ncbi:MAG TPA: xanthine dehydrogenase family protein subunit M [Chloroflexota bacterium]
MLRPFKVIHPGTAPDAVGELVRLGDQAKVYAGGAELILLMRHGILQADCLVDVKRIPELHGIQAHNGTIHIGAGVTHREIENDPLVRERLPALADAEGHIGNVRVRAQGTLGGNLCFADPHADPPTALLAYGADVQVWGRTGERAIPIDKFLVGTYETALEPEDIVTRIDVPVLPDGWRASFQRIERFQRPTVNTAVAARVQDGHIAGVRLVAGCVGPRATRLTELENRIQGQALADVSRTLAQSDAYLTEMLDPVDDLLGSASYKIHVTRVLLQRALGEACGIPNGAHA